MTRAEKIEKLRAHVSDVWPQSVVDAGVTFTRKGKPVTYRPVPRNISPLRSARDGDSEGMLAEMHRILDSPNFSRDHSPGWDRVCDWSYALTWEFQAVDPLAPWASLFTNTQRATVLQASRDSLVRRGA